MCDRAVVPRSLRLGRGTSVAVWTCVLWDSFVWSRRRPDRLPRGHSDPGRRPPWSHDLRISNRAGQRSPSPSGGCRSPDWRSGCPSMGLSGARGPFRVIPNAPGGWCLTALQHQGLTHRCPPSRWNYLSHRRVIVRTSATEAWIPAAPSNHHDSTHRRQARRPRVGRGARFDPQGCVAQPSTQLRPCPPGAAPAEQPAHARRRDLGTGRRPTWKT